MVRKFFPEYIREVKCRYLLSSFFIRELDFSLSPKIALILSLKPNQFAGI